MEIVRKQSTIKGPEKWFTGDVWFDVVARTEEPARARMNMVRFAPCARTAWHSHPLGQTLYVAEGIGLVQSRGGDVVVLRPGDASGHRRARSTGTAPRRTTSWSTLPYGRVT